MLVAYHRVHLIASTPVYTLVVGLIVSRMAKWEWCEFVFFLLHRIDSRLNRFHLKTRLKCKIHANVIGKLFLFLFCSSSFCFDKSFKCKIWSQSYKKKATRRNKNQNKETKIYTSFFFSQNDVYSSHKCEFKTFFEMLSMYTLFSSSATTAVYCIKCGSRKLVKIKDYFRNSCFESIIRKYNLLLFLLNNIFNFVMVKTKTDLKGLVIKGSNYIIMDRKFFDISLFIQCYNIHKTV